MAIFPQVDISVNGTTLSNESKELGRVFLFDFENGRYVLKDGKMVEATYEEAIRQWIVMLIVTELDHYKVYKDTGFGLELRNFVSRRDIPLGIINSEIKRQLEEKIIRHPQIVGIENFSTQRDDGKLIVTFTTLTLKGNFESEVSMVV